MLDTPPEPVIGRCFRVDPVAEYDALDGVQAVRFKESFVTPIAS
jgi:hypothetical protein